MNKFHKHLFGSLLVMMAGMGGVHADSKVVVIPLAGENLINTGARQGDVLGYVVVQFITGVATLKESWMATGGTPTISDGTLGTSRITWPGERYSITNQSAQATLYSAYPMFIALDSSSDTIVKTWDVNGNVADPFGYSVTIYQDGNIVN